MCHYTVHPEWQALFAAIKARPDDDLPRLVAADWLDEHGCTDRATYIRASCELAKQDAFGGWECNSCKARPQLTAGSDWKHLSGVVSHLAGCKFVLLGRERIDVPLSPTFARLKRIRDGVVTSGFEREILRWDWWAWVPLDCFFDPVRHTFAKRPACIIRRGFVEEVHADISFLTGGRCYAQHCDGEGIFESLTLLDPTVEVFNESDHLQMLCKVCDGVGQVSSILPGILELHPVTRVVAYDGVNYDQPGGHPFTPEFSSGESLPYHWRFSDENEPNTLPLMLQPSGETVRFRTPEEANDWLSKRWIEHFSP